MRLMFYLNGSKEEDLFLVVDDQHVIKWDVDASFAVHKDFRSHTGGAMSYGTGVPTSISRKQRLNTKSSTEAELFGVDDVTTMILWTKLFSEAQGYHISGNVVHQDNKSAILLERNGKRSSSKQTRAINIRCFFITDQIEKGNIEIKYCPPPRVDHLDVVGRLTPSMNGNQEFTTPCSLMSQAGPSHWGVCS
jgi:hypothetical protein